MVTFLRGGSGTILLALVLILASELTETSLASCEWSLAWSDEFNRASPGDGKLHIDATKWTVEVTDSPHNNELQSYVDSTDNIWEGEDGYVCHVVAR